ncbi:hypothetical protein PV10_02399 [Exophiala mesophila]|uniref:Uncharacterized protein n=1 Tax=Exophiala mesophila TaxID=212818 RepID=A0A0D1WYU2_EXOME|nr:uncharacterized protein PV10_02399 [Exophiala mesophila]KIV94655.1 hypothetical protein PV10_02399 [Exophiala mesophila]
MGGDPQSPDSINEGSLHVLELFGFSYTVLTFKEQYVSWLRLAERVNEQIQATRLFSARLGVDVPVFKREAVDKALEDTESTAQRLANSLIQWKTPLSLVDKSRPFLVLLPQNQEVIANLECLSNASQTLEREMESCKSLRANSTKRKPVNTIALQTGPIQGEKSADHSDSNYSINDLPPVEPGNPLHHKRMSRLRSRSQRNLIAEEQPLPYYQSVVDGASQAPTSDHQQNLYELPVAGMRSPSIKPQFTLPSLFPMPELQGDDGLFDVKGRIDTIGQLRYSTITPGIHHLNKADTTGQSSAQRRSQPVTLPVADVAANSAKSLQSPPNSDTLLISNPSNNNAHHNKGYPSVSTSQVAVAKPGKNLRTSTISTGSLGSPMPPIQEGEPVSNSMIADSKVCSQNPPTSEIEAISNLSSEARPAARPEPTGNLPHIDSTPTNLPQLVDVASNSTSTVLEQQMKTLPSSEDPRTETAARQNLSQPSPNGSPSPSLTRRSLPISTAPIFQYPFTTAKSFIIESPTATDGPSYWEKDQLPAHRPSTSDLLSKPDVGRSKQVPDSTGSSSNHNDAPKLPPTDVTYERANSLPGMSHTMIGINANDPSSTDKTEPSKAPHEMFQQRHTFPSQAQTATTLQQLQHLQHRRPISRYRDHVAEVVEVPTKGKEPMRNSIGSPNEHSQSDLPPQRIRPPYPVTPVQSPSEIVAKLLPATKPTSQQEEYHRKVTQQTLATAVASISAGTTRNSHQQNSNVAATRLSIERAASEVLSHGPYTAYSPPPADVQAATRPMSAPTIEHYKAYSTSETPFSGSNKAGPSITNAANTSISPALEDGLIPIPPAIEIAEVVRIQAPRMMHISPTDISSSARSPVKQQSPHGDTKDVDNNKALRPMSPAGLEHHVVPMVTPTAVSPPIPPKIPHPQSPVGKISVQFDQDHDHVQASSSSGHVAQQHDLARFSQETNSSPSKTAIPDQASPSVLDEQRSVSSSSAVASTVNAGTQASPYNPLVLGSSNSQFNLNSGSSADVSSGSPNGTPKASSHSMLSPNNPSNTDRIGGQGGKGVARRRRSAWLFAQVEKAGTATLGTGQ